MNISVFNGSILLFITLNENKNRNGSFLWCISTNELMFSFNITFNCFTCDTQTLIKMCVGFLPFYRHSKYGNYFSRGQESSDWMNVKLSKIRVRNMWEFVIWSGAGSGIKCAKWVKFGSYHHYGERLKPSSFDLNTFWKWEEKNQNKPPHSMVLSLSYANMCVLCMQLDLSSACVCWGDE